MPNKDKNVTNARRRERYANDPEFRAMIDNANYKWREENRAHHNAYHAEWKKNRRKIDREIFKKYDLQKMFKVSLEWYQETLQKQNKVCAICRMPETQIHQSTNEVCSLAVDHDRACCAGNKSCGRCVRGLLCAKCNQALHKVELIPHWLYYASDYLEKHKK